MKRVIAILAGVVAAVGCESTTLPPGMNPDSGSDAGVDVMDLDALPADAPLRDQASGSDAVAPVDGALPPDTGAGDAFTGDAPSVVDWPQSSACSGSRGVVGFHADRAIEVDGRMRAYDLYVPSALDGVPARMLVNMHGLNSDEDQQQTLSTARETADRIGYIVVLPRGNLARSPSGRGSGLSWNGGDCCSDSNLDDTSYDDVRFVRELIAQVGREFCVDRSRVYATGMSNGGYMTNRLACEAADLIAAFAPVAGGALTTDTSCSGLADQSTCEARPLGCAAHSQAVECVAAHCSWAGDRCVPGCAWVDGECRRRFLVGDPGALRSRTLPADGRAYSCVGRPGGVPVLTTFGSRDPAFLGASLPVGNLSSYAASFSQWRERARCGATPTRTERFECPYNAECGSNRTRVGCEAATNCEWSGDACRSVCDAAPGCRPVEPMSLLDIRTCRMRADETACEADSTCMWSDDGACTDCRDLVCEYYDDCGGTSVGVAGCVNESGTHCWPGSNRCSVAVDASGALVTINDLMWRFFDRFTLPRPGAS